MVRRTDERVVLSVGTPRPPLAVDGDREPLPPVRSIEAVEELPSDLGSAGCVVIYGSPRLDAGAVVDAVAERDPDLPVVGVVDDADEERRVLERGADEVLRRDAVDGALLADRVATAVARRRRVERRREDGEMLDALIEDLPVFLYFKDDRGRYVRFGEPLGGELSDAIGRANLWEDDPDELSPGEDRLLEDGVPIIRNEREWTTPVELHGEWVSETKVPWRDGAGDIKGIVGATYDVTEQKHRERELGRQNERLEEFASVVSHDLRNPLNVARAELDLASADVDSAHHGEIEWALGRMEKLIDDLLALAGKGRSVDDPEVVRLATVGEAAWRAVQAERATFVDECEPDVALQADPSRLRELLENLFRNAVEHAGPEVTVTVGALPDGFYVADDGPGVPPEDREELFEFGYTTEADGTGLGLAIVRSIANAHGWDVAATESESGGARFEVTDADRLDGLPSGPDGTDAPVAPGVDLRGRRFTVTGSGKNVWQYYNEFHFVHRRVTGDATITARVAGIDPAAEWSKAALVVRDRLDEYAAQAFVGLSGEHGSEFGYSPYPEHPTRTHNLDDGASVPHWYRLEREGDVVTGYGSPDGESWTELGREHVALGETVYVGLMVSSVEETATASATFDAVEGLDDPEHCDVGDVLLPGSVVADWSASPR